MLDFWIRGVQLNVQILWNLKKPSIWSCSLPSILGKGYSSLGFMYHISFGSLEFEHHKIHQGKMSSPIAHIGKNFSCWCKEVIVEAFVINAVNFRWLKNQHIPGKELPTFTDWNSYDHMLPHTYPCHTHPAASRKMDDKLQILSYSLKMRTNGYVENNALPPALQVAIREEQPPGLNSVCMLLWLFFKRCLLSSFWMIPVHLFNKHDILTKKKTFKYMLSCILC